MRFAAALTLLLVACAAPSEDAPDAGRADSGAPGGLATTCTGACRTLTLTATFGDNARAFDRAQFGFTAPDKSASGEWELYVEAHAGGDPACPGPQSPTPKQTLVLAGVRVPGDTTPQTKETGVSAAFLDFSGTLTDVPLLRATAVRVTPRAVRTCLDAAACPAGEERFFAFDLEASFEGGTIQGAAFALHCDGSDEN